MTRWRKEGIAREDALRIPFPVTWIYVGTWRRVHDDAPSKKPDAWEHVKHHEFLARQSRGWLRRLECGNAKYWLSIYARAG